FTILGSSKGVLSTVNFLDDSSAGNATFIVEGSAVPYAPSNMFFLDNADGGTATFIINGASVEHASGGSVVFLGSSPSAGSATLIANPGTNGGKGGLIQFFHDTDGGEARIEVFGNGILDVRSEGASVGSIEGDGGVLLGAHKLITGSNNLSTTFSGTIEQPGSLEKIGDGTLTLNTENTYARGTVLSAGALVINNTSGSATGTGAVQVDAGTLGGKGII